MNRSPTDCCSRWPSYASTPLCDDYLSRLLQAFGVFVLPSITEGIPFALLEACAYAKPVVATCVGSVPEAIADGRSGRLVEAGDVAGLADAIGALLCDEARARQLGQQAAVDVAKRLVMAWRM